MRLELLRHATDCSHNPGGSSYFKEGHLGGVISHGVLYKIGTQSLGHSSLAWEMHWTLAEKLEMLQYHLAWKE